jgi:hypothetical protein
MAPPPRPSPSPVNKLGLRHTGRLRKRDKLLTGERRQGVGGGANKKARSSVNHSLISGLWYAYHFIEDTKNT